MRPLWMPAWISDGNKLSPALRRYPRLIRRFKLHREKSQDSLRQPVEAAGKFTGDESDMAAGTRKFERHCIGNLVRRR